MKLIDADELRNELTSICSDKVNDYNKAVKAFIEFIDNAPTVDIKTEVSKELAKEAREIADENYKYGYEKGKADAERPHGKWEYNQYDGNPIIGNWHCSECRYIVFGGYSQKPYYNFCPNCGADMRVKDELNQVKEGEEMTFDEAMQHLKDISDGLIRVIDEISNELNELEEAENEI